MSTKVLQVHFQNNSGLSLDQISVGFLPGPGSVTPSIINIADKSAIQTLEGANNKMNWYQLDSLDQGVEITAFSGRIYLCYGPPWSSIRPGYEPGQTPTDPNFYLRYDKVEITFTGSDTDVANLSSIDYWSIPMTLKVFKNGQPTAPPENQVNGLKPGVSAADVFQALVKLTTPPVSGLSGNSGPDGKPLPALVPGQFVQFPPGPPPGTAFARIIGPSSYPPIGAVPVLPYSTMIHYLEYLLKTFGPGTAKGKEIPGLGDGIIARIAGDFAGVGANPTDPAQEKQTYDLNAIIDSQLNITLSGTCSVVGPTTMKFAIAGLEDPAGIYGGNAPFILNNGNSPHSGNDVYQWISGDMLSGINIGALGSSIPPSGSNIPVGALPSQQWFKQLTPDQLFGNLQPDNPFYNVWAATLAPLSDSYNFAYTDRFAHVFVTLDPNRTDSLQILLDDARVPYPMTAPTDDAAKRPTRILEV